MTPTARITALYAAGRYQDGQNLNRAIAVALGGSVASGGAIAERRRTNGVSNPVPEARWAAPTPLKPTDRLSVYPGMTSAPIEPSQKGGGLTPDVWHLGGSIAVAECAHRQSRG